MKLFALGKFVILPWLRAIPISEIVQSVCVCFVPNRAYLGSCARVRRATERVKALRCSELINSFERTLSLVSLFLRERFDLVRDLFFERRRVKAKKNCKKSSIYFGANFLGETDRQFLQLKTSLSPQFQKETFYAQIYIKVVGSSRRASFFLFKRPPASMTAPKCEERGSGFFFGERDRQTRFCVSSFSLSLNFPLRCRIY